METTMMRAAVISAPCRVEIREVPRPSPKPTEVRVRLEGCGLCASGVPSFEGRAWFTYPLEAGRPGHEGWGVVDALGEEVTGVRVGDRVAFLSDHAFAEYDVAQDDSLVRLPAALDGQPMPAEPLGCAMNVARRAKFAREEVVAIVGTGFMGVLLTRLAVRAGAYVIAISRRPYALKLAKQFGAALTIPLDDRQHVIEQVMAWTTSAGADCVIEATGEQQPLDLAAALTRVRGRLVIAGYHQDGPRQVDMELWNWRGLDVINAHERDPHLYVRGMRESVDAVVSRHLDPNPLFTHRFRLAELGKAFTTQIERPDGFIKALVMMT